MESIWMKDYKKFNIPKINNNLNTDILIIGGGIAGLMTAYYLMKNNIKFTLVDAEYIAKGVSSKTTAHLSAGQDVMYQEIKKRQGILATHNYYHSQLEGLKAIKHIIKQENIKCDFKTQDAYVYANDLKGIKKLNKEYKVLKNINADIEMLELNTKPIKYRQAIVYKKQAIFNPMKYMMNILQILMKENTRLFEQSRVTKINKVNDYYEVIVNDSFIIKTNKIIMACHYPILNPSGLYFTKLYQSISYAISFKANLKLSNNYTSVDEPYYTLRSIDNHLFIIGGSDHYSGININFDACFKRLEDKIFSLDKKAEIINKWWTEDCMSIDSLPFIGEYSNKHKNILLITGFNKWGFLNAHVAAMNITNLFLGREYNKFYRTNRYPLLRSLKNTMRMIIHSIDGLVISRITVKKCELSDILIGTGKVLRYKNMNILAYRESTDKYIVLKNKCTHMGCTLIWNNTNKVWQSKCHGSVFDIYGNVLEGPALKPLERIYL